ncbi:eORF15 [Murid betaherpesvirus 8]|uniref:EORF15 n=1 Tax=Rat cytomegalovirus (isolate England) TaxID=1261657 RepID=K7YNU2_RCMVE|nr:eORF15 [Murid betaherpesvirus 8]AFX83472.1 eORF15 [Murid betaherpesvirus 8]
MFCKVRNTVFVSASPPSACVFLCIFVYFCVFLCIFGSRFCLCLPPFNHRDPPRGLFPLSYTFDSLL